jgi:para-nitrobenzyl esterase
MHIRRLILAATMLAQALPTVAAAQSELVVAVEAGQVAGRAEGDVESWKGIPFAAPPVSELRWRAPQPAAAWQGVRQTVSYGHDCMQVPFPSDAAPLGTPPAEDCLYLNVWRPAGTGGKLPVIFWIYGGGFVNGGASPPTYSGANLAKQGVMFVSANYRVGRFGTFAHPQLTAEDADGGLVGNYGYMDQLAALRWIQRNIAAFGGDPSNVTIVGESAGGMSVHTLVTSPLAKGLFAKAVVMSGGDGGAMGGNGLAAAERIGVDFARSKGIAQDDPDALARLRALSAEDVTDGLNMMALFRPTGPRTFASPFVDGKLAVGVGAAYAAGAFERVPMMIGATSADIGGKTGAMVAGARRVSATIADSGVPVYAYRFSYVAESVGQPGAQHATDIPFFFDTAAVKYGDETTSRDAAMGQTMSAYLTNFARTGDPNGTGLPTWPRYARATDRIMDFAADGQAVAQKDPWGPEIDATVPPSVDR